MKKRVFIFTVLVLLIAANALAYTCFRRLDANGDDAVTPEEYSAFFADNAHARDKFPAVDANKDGVIDHDEWHDFTEKHGLEHPPADGEHT